MADTIEDVIATLRALTNRDHSEEIRIEAVRGLGRYMPNANALDTLRALTNRDVSEKIRLEAIRALASRGIAQSG